MAHLYEQRPGPGAGHPQAAALDFRLENDQQQPVLHTGDVAQGLTLQVYNRSSEALRGDPGDGPPLALAFRPGTLSKKDEVKPDGGWSGGWADGPGGAQVLQLTPANPVTLPPGAALALRLTGARADRVGGSRTTRVELRAGLRAADGGARVGRRTHHLALLPMDTAAIEAGIEEVDAKARGIEKELEGILQDGKPHDDHVVAVVRDLEKLAADIRKGADLEHDLLPLIRPPIDAGVDGPARVVCGGRLKNRLRLVIRNRSTHAISLHKGRLGMTTFAFELGPWQAEHDPDGLLAEADLESVQVKDVPLGFEAKLEDGKLVLVNRNRNHLEARELLALALEGFPCSAAPGTAHVMLHYENVGVDYKHGDFVIAVERGCFRPLGKTRAEMPGAVDLLDAPRVRLRYGAHKAGGEEHADAELALEQDGTLRMRAKALRFEAAGGAPVETVESDGEAALNVSGELCASGPLRIAGDLESASLEAGGALRVGQGVRCDGPDYGNLLPKGAILLWSRPLEEIPSGWAICDGEGGTPDLRSRFVVGASGRRGPGGLQTYGPGERYGAETVALTARHLPEHTHELDDPGHRHRYKHHPGDDSDDGDDADDYNFREREMSDLESSDSEAGLSLEDSGHAQPEAHENMPPFHALVYIMRL